MGTPGGAVKIASPPYFRGVARKLFTGSAGLRFDPATRAEAGCSDVAEGA
jgi:hypothetical protein